MRCLHVDRYLDALMDDELDPSARIEVDRHLVDCSACGARLALARALRERLRAGVLPTGGASAALRARVAAALREERAPTWTRLEGSWRATAAAALVALAVLGVGGAIETEGVAMQAGFAPIFDDVVRAHARDVPAEIDRQEQIPAYFEDKVGFRVKPVAFADPSVRFVGARDSRVGGRQSAMLQYEVHGRRMTVVVFRPPAHAARLGEPLDTDGGRVVRVVRVHGHVVPVVEHEGLVYAVVSDLDADDRVALAAHASLH